MTKNVSEDDIVALGQYLDRLNKALAKNGETFEQKLDIIDLLQVQVYLYRDNGEPKMNIRCRFAYEEGVSIATTTNLAWLTPVKITFEC